MAGDDTTPTPVKKRRTRKVPGRSLKTMEHVKELTDSDYVRAAKMLRSNGHFSIKATRERLEHALEFCKMQPIIEIVKIAQDPEVSPELRLKANMFLGNKMLPDLKSVDMQVEEKHDIQIVLKSFARTVDVADLARPVVAHEINRMIGAS